MNFPRAFAVFVVVCSLSHPVMAQVYKCKSSSGTTVFSDAPCEYDAKQVDPRRLQGNSLDTSQERQQNFAAQERQYESQSSQSGRASSAHRSGNNCPSDQQIRSLETSASSITLGKREREFVQSQLQRAQACRSGGAGYSPESLRATEEAVRDQNRISAADRERARSRVGGGATPKRNFSDDEHPSTTPPKIDSPTTSRITSCQFGKCKDNLGNYYQTSPVGNQMRQLNGGKSCTFNPISGSVFCP